MNTHPISRIVLLVLQILVALTAFAGGAALVVGTFAPELAVSMVPPTEYLAGSPFSSYLVPGFILAIVLGGVHLVAFIMLLRRHRWALLAAAVAAFDAMIWIFVQMIIIPFSMLQVVYFAVGLAEVGFVLLILGVLRPQNGSTHA